MAALAAAIGGVLYIVHELRRVVGDRELCGEDTLSSGEASWWLYGDNNELVA